jgi:hypothetical protein
VKTIGRKITIIIMMLFRPQMPLFGQGVIESNPLTMFLHLNIWIRRRPINFKWRVQVWAASDKEGNLYSYGPKLGSPNDNQIFQVVAFDVLKKGREVHQRFHAFLLRVVYG